MALQQVVLAVLFVSQVLGGMVEYPHMMHQKGSEVPQWHNLVGVVPDDFQKVNHHGLHMNDHVSNDLKMKVLMHKLNVNHDKVHNMDHHNLVNRNLVGQVHILDTDFKQVVVLTVDGVWKPLNTLTVDDLLIVREKVVEQIKWLKGITAVKHNKMF